MRSSLNFFFPISLFFILILSCLSFFQILHYSSPLNPGYRLFSFVISDAVMMLKSRSVICLAHFTINRNHLPFFPSVSGFRDDFLSSFLNSLTLGFFRYVLALTVEEMMANGSSILQWNPIKPAICWLTTHLDSKILRFSWHEQVIGIAFKFLSLPTTSWCIKEYTNAQVPRVFKYPNLVTFTNQGRVDLRFVVLHCKNLHIQTRSSLKYATDILEFFCGMGTSPRSVLDATFQCAAVPICLEERSSSSLELALRRTLAGRLLTSKRPSVQNLTLAASRLWNCSHRLSCYDHGKCLYSFEFTYAPDVERVVAGGPWYINGDMLLISRMNPNQSIEQLPFPYTKLWVRCFDLPPKCFTKDYAEAIGNSLGKFCESDLPPEDPDEAMLLVQKIPTVRKYLRVKFEFNLYGPLKSSQSIKICNDKKVVVAEHISRLTYERLPHTCFRCGFLGHLVEECTLEGPLLYGEWIRAERFFRINFQNAAIPKAVSTSKEGQSSTAMAGIGATQVTEMSELVNTLINDPSIIRADYSLARAEGPLPISKGKAPILDLPQSSTLVPYTSVSPQTNISTTVFGPNAESILGSIPSIMRSHSSTVGSDSVIMETEEGHFASFLNALNAHDDAFAVNPSRCLFKMDSHLTVGSPSKGSPPANLSPIVSGDAEGNQVASKINHLSEVFKDELRKLPVGRKRAPVNPQTPRPKRGRQSSNSDGQG